MKTVTVTMDEAVLRRALIAAVGEGKSLSTFIAETVERRIGCLMTQSEATENFLAGPPIHLLDEDGKAPTRDRIYE